MCPGPRGGFDARAQGLRFRTADHVHSPATAPLAPSPQGPTYRMKPVSVVIVSPGTTKCFLVSRPRLSLRGLRATGSLISIAILAPNDLRRRSPPRAAISGSTIPGHLWEGRGGAGLRAAANGDSRSGHRGDSWQSLGSWEGKERAELPFLRREAGPWGIKSHVAWCLTFYQNCIVLISIPLIVYSVRGN